MWARVNTDSGFVTPGFEADGAYFRLDEFSYLRVTGPSHLTGLYYISGQSTTLGAQISLGSGYPSQEDAQAALDDLVKSNGVALLDAPVDVSKSVLET